MITRPDTPHRENRVFRIALIGSLVAHVLFAVFAIATYDFARRAFHFEAPLKTRKPADEIVTISSALRFEKRAKPAPVAPRRAASQRPASQQPLSPPRHATLPMPKPVTAEVRKPVLPRPVALEHELAKLQHRAPPQVVATPARPTSAPHPTRDSRTQVATVGKRAESRISTERLAQIERDLAKTIAQVRSETNPLRTVPREPPAAPKHYRLQMQGASRTLRRGEGYYYPVKSWRANGLDFYYVSYEFTWPNGVYETGSVPWPIHFTPGGDPFASADPLLVNKTPLPPPPSDYVPPGTLGKALRAYFPKLVFSDSDS